MADWLDEYFDHRRLQRGDIIPGRVVHISEDSIMIDVGAKSEGVVKGRELELMDSEMLAQLREGDEVMVYVITPEDREGNILLSIKQAQLAMDWQRIQKLYEEGELFQAKVAGHNKGGLIVYLGQVRGFVPASQLDRRRRMQFQESGTAQPWDSMVGEELWLKVIEVDPSQNRLILSEQAAVRQRRKGKREQLFKELEEGAVVTGEVTSLADFGAFVDLGGADGLIHISELSWQRVKHPSEVLQVGDQVEVQVIHIDRERHRIGLSLKRLQPEPWEVIAEQCKEGDIVEGTVTKLTNFGAFVRINEGVEGLIHISELTDRAINHPKEVVREGQVVKARVIRIEPERRRIGLSLKQVDEDEVEAADAAEELVEAQ
jgi:small subunit ribosomal protein S1